MQNFKRTKKRSHQESPPFSNSYVSKKGKFRFNEAVEEQIHVAKAQVQEAQHGYVLPPYSLLWC